MLHLQLITGVEIIKNTNKHRIILNNCTTNKGLYTYGSKGCVVIEDSGVEVLINGGVFEDAYPNGDAKFIGSAFIVSDSILIANDCIVNNCSAVSTSTHSIKGRSYIEINNIHATNIRTSGHIENKISYGTTIVKYNNCNINIIGSQLWTDVKELSIPTVIANMKTSSNIYVYLNNCNVSGADVLEINTNGCYGSLNIYGGIYNLNYAIIDSLGWGSANDANKTYGFIVKHATFNINYSTYNSLNNLGTGIIIIRNLDKSNVYTRLHVYFDRETTIELLDKETFIACDNITISGNNLNDGIIILSTLTNLALLKYYDDNIIRSLTYMYRSAIAGTNWRIIIKSNDNKKIEHNKKLLVGSEFISILSVNNTYIQDNALYEELYITAIDGEKLTENTSYRLL